MKHRIPHGLDQALARRVIRRALEGYVARFVQYSPRLTWQGEDRAEIAFSALGATVRGVFALGPATLDVEMDVPLLLRPFRARAIEVVEREVQDWIARARQGQLDGADA